MGGAAVRTEGSKKAAGVLQVKMKLVCISSIKLAAEEI